MRSICPATIISASLLIGLGAAQSLAQELRLGPIELAPRRPVPPAYAGEEVRTRMFHLREECEEGERRACVRLGVIIGQNERRVGEWRREHPELFFFER
jgi:hypothetical protein